MQPEAQTVGKWLLVIGGILLLAGGIILLTGKLPNLFRLPGDIVIEKKNYRIYFPIVTSIVLSVVVTLVIWLVGRFLK